MKKVLFLLIFLAPLAFGQYGPNRYGYTGETGYFSKVGAVTSYVIDDSAFTASNIDTTQSLFVGGQLTEFWVNTQLTDTGTVAIDYRRSLDGVSWTNFAPADSLTFQNTGAGVFSKDMSAFVQGAQYMKLRFRFKAAGATGTHTYTATYTFR